MSGTPLVNQVTGRWISQQTREINNEYYIQIQARNSEAALRCQRAQLKAQVAAAALNLRGQMEIAQRQDTANQILGGLAGDMGSLLGLAEQMSGHLESIESTLENVNATIQQGFASVTAVLERAVTVLVQQQKTITQIADTLSRPNETEARECLRDGQIMLDSYMKTEGREQQENAKDALRLFQRVIDNEIGKQSYVAWFNIGYLRWHHLKDVVQAEEAFFQAQRLSGIKQDYAWQTQSLRHMAEMQRLQDRVEEAYHTVHRALAISREYASLLCAARYAKKTSKAEEFMTLLDECIEMRPETIITMFAEEDFKD